MTAYGLGGEEYGQIVQGLHALVHATAVITPPVHDLLVHGTPGALFSVQRYLQLVIQKKFPRWMAILLPWVSRGRREGHRQEQRQGQEQQDEEHAQAHAGVSRIVDICSRLLGKTAQQDDSIGMRVLEAIFWELFDRELLLQRQQQSEVVQSLINGIHRAGLSVVSKIVQHCWGMIAKVRGENARL